MKKEGNMLKWEDPEQRRKNQSMDLVRITSKADALLRGWETLDQIVV